MQNRFPMTDKGVKKLEEERMKLKNVDRPNVVKAISVARELGDLSENAEYQYAREQQSFIEGRIKDLDFIISSAEVVDIKKNFNGKFVIFGVTVIIRNIETEEIKRYQIVGEHEADITRNLLSYKSPIGKSLISKQKGNIVNVITPNNTKSWEILDIMLEGVE